MAPSRLLGASSYSSYGSNDATAFEEQQPLTYSDGVVPGEDGGEDRPIRSKVRRAAWALGAGLLCLGLALSAAPTRLSMRKAAKGPSMYAKPAAKSGEPTLSPSLSLKNGAVKSAKKTRAAKRTAKKSAKAASPADGKRARKSKKDTTTSSNPNIIVIVADDLGIGDIFTSEGTPQESHTVTPRLEELLANGIKLDNFYSQPLSTSARAAFLTGKYPVRMGLQHGDIGATGTWAMPTDETTLAEIMQGYGYKTALMGKWHLGHAKSEYTPLERGFDEFFGYYTSAINRYTKTNAELCSSTTTYASSSSECYMDLQRHDVLESDNNTFITTMISRNARNWITEHTILNKEFESDDPFFMVVGYPNVAHPIKVDDILINDPRVLPVNQTCRRRYLADLIALDHSVSQIVEVLDGTDQLDNTIIFFFSDNGAETDLECGSNEPFRGKKGTYFQGGIKVPAFVYSPLLDTSLAGTTYDGLFHVTDIFNTIVEGILGDADLDTTDIDGVNHWDTLTSTDDDVTYPRTEMLINIDGYNDTSNPIGGYIYDNWKLIINSGSLGWWKYDGSDNWENQYGGSETVTNFLFNLDDDPYEQTNLYDTYPSLATTIKEKMYEYYDSTVYVDPLYETSTTSTTVEAYWEEHDDHILPWLDEDDE